MKNKDFVPKETTVKGVLWSPTNDGIRIQLEGSKPVEFTHEELSRVLYEIGYEQPSA